MTTRRATSSGFGRRVYADRGLPDATIRAHPSAVELFGHPTGSWADGALWRARCIRTTTTGSRPRSENRATTGGSFDLTYRLIGEDGAVISIHDQAMFESAEGVDAGAGGVWHGVMMDTSERQGMRIGSARSRFATGASSNRSLRSPTSTWSTTTCPRRTSALRSSGSSASCRRNTSSTPISGPGCCTRTIATAPSPTT